MSGPRRLLSVIAIAAGLALVPLSAAEGVASQGICPKPFPDPRISLKSPIHTIQRGRTATFGGHLTRNSCPLPGQTLAIFMRERPGPFTYVGQRTTDARGAYSFIRNAPRSYDVKVVMAKTKQYAHTESRVFHMTVTAAPPPKVIYTSGCKLPNTIPMGAKPPQGIRVDLLLNERSVRSGDTLHGNVRITNQLHDVISFDEIAGARAAILRNVRTGELATPTYFSSVNNIVEQTLKPRRSITLPVSVKTVTCEEPVLGPRIHPGDYSVIASVELTWLGQRTTWVPDFKTVEVTP